MADGNANDRATVARAFRPEPSSNTFTPASPRHIKSVGCARIAWISGAFTLVLAATLMVNSYHLHRGPGNGRVRLVESRELLPLKAALRKDPKNDTLKQQIRTLDQQLRHDYFRREMLAARGSWILLGSSVLFLLSLQGALRLRHPVLVVPNLSARPEDPVRTAATAAKAVTGASLALAGLAIALGWSTTTLWQGDLTKIPTPATAAPTGDAASLPTADEIANNWPCFRGPGGNGRTTLTNTPTTWDGPSGKNILWKTQIDLPGHNSPVIWDKRVFLTGATAKRREVYCLDAVTGALLWKQAVGTPQSDHAEAPKVEEATGYAAPTAVTDGRRVFAIFANGDIAGLTAEGKPLWARNLGTPESTYGYASSLTSWHHLVIVLFDQGRDKPEGSKIMALDAATGETVWSTPRAVPGSWASPIIITCKGRDQIITCANPWVIAYDPATGAELWKAECMRGDIAASPTFANDLVYVGSDQLSVAAIKPDGNGNVTESKIVWTNEDDGKPDLCSLLCDGPRVYTMLFGVLHAFDALTGKHLWKYSSDAQFQASPAWVNGKIHLLTNEGVTLIGEADHAGFKETGRAELDEKTGASPAFAPGRIYLRGNKHLFCIGNKDDI